MSEVRVNQAHNLPVDQAVEKLKDFEDMVSKYGVKLVWNGHRAELKGTGVSGGVEVGPNNVSVLIKLGLLARAAGVDPSRLEASIRKRLTAAFGG
ncbi:MAG: hypothetical protein GMKNLPBB_00364 [Myxococcota bacterium]|nr:hypothetical protein [Myxococcota bacterium]